MAASRPKLLALVTALAALAAACTGQGADPSAVRHRVGGIVVAGIGLQSFDACDDALAWLQDSALAMVGPYGLDQGFDGPGMGDMEFDAAVADDGAGEQAAGRAAATAPQEGVDYSGTNVQESGVDEPDTVKTDGRRLLVVTDSRLHLLDVSGGQAPSLESTVPLGEGWGHELLLHGDRLLVTTRTHREVHLEDEVAGSRIHSDFWGGQALSRFTLFDLSGATPRVLETLEVEGHTVSSRLVDGVARVVVRSDPDPLPFATPEAAGWRAERDATTHNRDVVKSTSVEDWLPGYTHTDADGADRTGQLVDCERVHHPAQPAGPGTLTVLSLDLDGPLTPGGATAVAAGGETVYATPERLYVATNRWVDWRALQEEDAEAAEADSTTELHAFDLTDPAAARYLGSGQVRGHVLNQWSLSAHDGVLRVATTDGPTWWGWREDADQRVSESFVTTFAESGGALTQLGQVGGLGLDERIYAVRFMGDLAYVVTFRETDPLYTVDLADPARPRVVGELKIPGYSAYLHPVAFDEDGRVTLLLGLGQDATDRGELLGTQVSLFDVSDLANPRRLHTYGLERSHSAAEHDHRAFLHWAPTGLTVVPWSRWEWNEEDHTETFDTGVVALTADREDGIAEVGRLTHLRPELATEAREDEHWELGWRSQIQRTLVVSGTLYTVSELGVAANDLSSLTSTGWVRLPLPDGYPHGR